MKRKTTGWVMALFACLLLTTCAKPTATLQIDAQIVYAVGGAQPVARETVYLLIADPMKAPNSDASIDGSLLYQQLTAQNALEKLSKQEFAASFLKTARVWRPFVRATATTDFQGQANFPPLAPATYWVLMVTQTRAGAAMWSLPITLKTGANRALLGTENAFFAE